MNYQRSLLALALALGLSVTASAAPTTWNSDPSHSTVGFSVRHMMISTVRGSFGDVKAVLTLDEKKINHSTVEASIGTASINTGAAKRDQHLQSPDFFNSEKFPAMTFKSTSVKRAGRRHLKVRGDLTIRDVTRPVTLDVRYTKAFKHPMTGGQVRGATATTKIDRTKWGLSWNMALESGGFIVGKEIKIELSLEFNLKAAAGSDKADAAPVKKPAKAAEAAKPAATK